MRNGVVSVALAAALILPEASGARAQTYQPDTAVVRTQIEINNRAVGKAIATRDFAALEKLWSPDMLVNSPGNNILTRAQVFAAMREEKLAYTSIKTTLDAFSVSRDVAIEMATKRLSCPTDQWQVDL